LWASAGARGWFRSGRLAVILLVTFLVAPAVFHVKWASPLGALQQADDGIYKFGSRFYWIAIVVTQAISWVLLITAGGRLRRSLQAEDEVKAQVPPTTPARAVKTIGPETDPIAWLVRRQYGLKAVIWTAVLLGTLYTLGFGSLGRWFGFWRFGYFFPGINLAISIVQGCLFAWAASRFFVSARQTGEFEILLTTPLGADRIVSSQWTWIKELLFWPLIVAIAPRALEIVSYLNSYLTSTWGTYGMGMPAIWTIFFAQTLGGVNLVVGTLALFWVGILQGLKVKSQSGAIIRTILLAKGAPYLINSFFSIASTWFLAITVGVPGRSWFAFSSSGVITLLYYLWLIRWARAALRTELGHGR
jgi:hypothetical protein